MCCRLVQCFPLCQPLGNGATVCAAHVFLDRVFIDLRWLHGERHADIAKDLRPAAASRRQNETHALATIRSAIRLMMAAAVSSIERRETSSDGQSCCSKSLRVALISARTLSTST